MAAKFPYGKGPVKLVSTEWLGEQLGSDKVTILDVQPNIHDYVLEHIPGAFYLNEGHYRHYHGNLPALWIEPQEIEQLFQVRGHTTRSAGGGIYRQRRIQGLG